MKYLKVKSFEYKTYGLGRCVLYTDVAVENQKVVAYLDKLYYGNWVKDSLVTKIVKVKEKSAKITVIP